MNRYIDFDEETDGKRYSGKDMARLGCNDCNGCHKCCTGMGKSIVLDPYDIYMLKKCLKRNFDDLVNSVIELSVTDNLILPNLLLTGEDEHCTLLDDNGRCSIHESRPGFCRMFPLGRIYENGTFSYFLQTKECRNNKTKVKIDKWIGIKDFEKYEKFVNDWHYFLKDMDKIISKDESMKKNAVIVVLKIFYWELPVEKDFYEEFYARLDKINNIINGDDSI